MKSEDCDRPLISPQGKCFMARARCPAAEIITIKRTGWTALVPKSADSLMPLPPITYPVHVNSTSVANASATGHASLKIHPTGVAGSRTCHDIFDMNCPGCDGYGVGYYNYNRSYTVQCNVRPICGAIDAYTWNVTQDSCLGYCNDDPTCFGAIHRPRRCDLCRGSVQLLVAYEPHHKYPLFIARPFWGLPPPWAFPPPNSSG